MTRSIRILLLGFTLAGCAAQAVAPRDAPAPGTASISLHGQVYTGFEFWR